MEFYKKLTFSILAFLFCFAVMIKLIEPVIERQFSKIFADKKLSKKLMRELINSTEARIVIQDTLRHAFERCKRLDFDAPKP